MKKRNLIIGGVLLLLLTAAAVFLAVNSLAAPNYPRGVADIKSGEVKVVFENLPTEYIEVKELYSLQYYMEKYPKAKEIMGYYKGTVYYWTKDEKKVLNLGGLEGQKLTLSIESGDVKMGAIYAPGVDLTIDTGSKNTLTLTLGSNYKYIGAAGAAVDLSKPNTTSSESGNLTVTGHGILRVDTTGSGKDGATYGLYAKTITIGDWSNIEMRMGNKKKEVSHVMLSSDLTFDTMGYIDIKVFNTKTVAYSWSVNRERLRLLNARYLQVQFERHELWGEFGTHPTKEARLLWTELNVYGKIHKAWLVDTFYSARSSKDSPYKIRMSRSGSMPDKKDMDIKINGAEISSDGMVPLYAGKPYSFSVSVPLPDWFLQLEKEGRVKQKFMLSVYDGTKLLYESRGNNTFKVPKTGTYTLFVEWYYRNPGITIYWDELSCITKTLTTVALEEGVLIQGPVEYSRTDAFYGGTITATLPNVTDLSGVVYQWKYNDPETGVGKNIKGENGPSIKLNKAEYVNKSVYLSVYGKDGTKYYGAIHGKLLKVKKAYNSGTPAPLDVVATKSKDYYDGYRITNFDSTKYDYVVSKTNYTDLSKIDWSKKLTSATGKGYYTGDKLYFYYRLAGTDVKKPGFIIHSRELLIDEIVRLGSITLDGVENGTVFIKPGQTINLRVKLNPATANEFTYFDVKTYDTQVFEIVSPKNKVTDLNGFTTITIKGKKVGYGSFALYYPGPSGPEQNTYGGAQVVVYTPTDMGPNSPILSYKPDFSDVTLEEGEVYTLPTDLPSILPRDVQGYSLVWGVGKKAKDNLGYTTYIYDFENEYAKIEGGKVIAKKKTTDPVAVVLCILKPGEKPSAAYRAQFMLTVRETPVVKPTGVTVSTKSLSMHVGGVWTLNAAIAPVDAVGTFTIKYSSSNPKVVKVDENTGFITAVGTGSATITAKANNDSSLVGTCTVTVNDHSFGKWTPSNMGSLNHQRVCSCGMLETEEHTYGAWTNDDSKGKHVHKCTVCGNSEYAEHIESPWITDTEAGVGVEGRMHTECYDCGKIMKTDVAPAIPDYEISVAGGKAVDSAGKTLARAAAGESITVTADPAPEGKVFGGWIAKGITLEDTTAETVTFTMPEGAVKLTADYRDAERPHSHEADTGKWYFDENYHWNACRDKSCSEYLNREEHSFVWKTDKPATDTEDGISHEECTVCGKKRNENTVIKKSEKDPSEGPHSHEADTGKWYFDENYHWNACRDESCSEYLNREEHSFVWITDKPATDTEDGISHEECSVCGKKRNENTVIKKSEEDTSGGNEPKDPTETDNHGKPGGNTGTENKSWILPTVVASASVFVGGGLTALIIALVKKKKSDGCIPGNPGSTDGTE